MKLLHKNVLITGASGGIGRALAIELARRGACVFLAGRDEVGLRLLLSSLNNPSRHRVLLFRDYSDSEIAMLAEELSGSQRLDILINNAGVNKFSLLESQSVEEIREQIRVNVELPILITRQLLGRFNSNGMVVNVGSVMGDIGYPGYSVYCASKFALRGFSEALGRELHGHGIKVLYTAPRSTRTSINSQAATAMNRALGNSTDTPEVVALGIVRAIEKEHLRSHFGWPERLFIKINALFPWLVDNAISRKVAMIRRYARLSVTGEAK
ncbi:SDR family oxidoreductase [Pantoea sp. B65]|uniref:SDR family oxidoreductase n=1 Tax=Pantoea sp. B65 TaxID=2813359 RepID=UPI0039B5B71F